MLEYNLVGLFLDLLQRLPEVRSLVENLTVMTRYRYVNLVSRRTCPC